MNKYLFFLIIIFSLISCKEYTLTTDVYPESSGSVNPSRGVYKKKSLVSVEAIPKENYKFVKWGLNPIVGYGDNTNPLQFNIFEDITLVAEFELIDEDGDGIPDNLDNCPNSPFGVSVSSDGCALSQKDTDGDGVTDDKDNCDDTPEGEDVNENGCSDSQKDTDGDGVTDDKDTCEDTPEGEDVDENGCSDSQKDIDGDGVTDDKDNCEDTPEGEDVDENGCSDSQKDTDGDGVTDDKDNCDDTPEGEDVDENGCSDSQRDTDGDGVTDDKDLCSDTPLGVNVDENGCSLYGDLTKILTFGSKLTLNEGNVFRTFTPTPSSSQELDEGVQGIMGFDFDQNGNVYFGINYRGVGYFFRMLPDNNNILSFDIREDNGFEVHRVWSDNYRRKRPDHLTFYNDNIYLVNTYDDGVLNTFSKSDLIGTATNSSNMIGYSFYQSGNGGWRLEEADIDNNGMLYVVGFYGSDATSIFKKEISSLATSGYNTMTTVVNDINTSYNLGWLGSADRVSDMTLSDTHMFISYYNAGENSYNKILKINLSDFDDYEIITLPEEATNSSNNLAEDWTTSIKYNSISSVTGEKFVISSGGIGKVYYYNGSQVIDISNELSSNFERPIEIQYHDGYIYLIDESQTLKNCDVYAGGKVCYSDFYFYRFKLN